MRASWTNVLYSALQSLAYKQGKYVPAGAWCEIIKEIEVIPVDTVDTVEAAAQPKPYAVAAGLVSLDDKVYIEGNFVLPTKVPTKKMQHYRVEYDQNAHLHYVQEKKSAKDHIAYVPVVLGDSPTPQPADQQSPGWVLKEQPTTDRAAPKTTRNESCSAKQALDGLSKKSYKISSPALEDERDTASSPFLGATKSEPEPPLDHGSNLDGDSSASISLAHINETLHSRNTSSTMSTIFSNAGRSSRSTTPSSPCTPMKGEYQETHTDVDSKSDELLKLIESMPSAISASYATPLGTITSDRPGAWLETRECHEETIVDPILEAVSENSAQQPLAEFLDDVASSFLKKKTTGPFCWIEIGNHNYMTVWNYICGYLDHASHHGWKDLKKDLCRPDEVPERQAKFQDAQADHAYENVQPDTVIKCVSDLPSDPAILSYGKVIGKIHGAASEEQPDPVADSSINLAKSLFSPTATEDKPERDDGPAHVFASQSPVTQKNEVKEEEPKIVDSQYVAIDTAATFHQDAGKGKETLRSSSLPPESSTPDLSSKNMLEGGHASEHVGVGDPWIKQDNEVWEEEPADMKSQLLPTDTVSAPHDAGANEDKNILDLTSTERSVATVSLTHMLKGGNGLQPVFVGHLGTVQNIEVRGDDSGDTNSEPVATSTTDVSDQETEAETLQTPDSSSISTESVIPFVSLEQTTVAEGTEDEETSDMTDNHLPTTTDSEELSEDTHNEEIPVPVTSCTSNQEELEISEGTNFEHMPDVVDAPIPITANSDISCENTGCGEKSQPEQSAVSTAAESDTPYYNLDYETTHSLSLVYPCLKPSQVVGNNDEAKAKPSHVSNDDESSVLAKDISKKESTKQDQIHVSVEHNQTIHPEETDTGKMFGDENDHMSTATDSDKSYGGPKNEDETEQTSSDISPSQGSNMPSCDLQHDLSHVIVGHRCSTSCQDAQEEDQSKDDSSRVSDENIPVLDKDASNNEEDVDSIPSCDHEDASALAEEDNSESTINFNLKRNQVQRIHELETSTINHTEDAPLCQNVEENHMIEQISPNTCTAVTIYHHSPKVSVPILMVEQKPVMDLGATGSQCQVYGAPLIQLEVDEIYSSIRSIRQLFKINRVTKNPIETRESDSNDVVEDSKGREVILRSVFLNNAAEMKMARFVELTNIGMQRPKTDAISIGLSASKPGMAVVRGVTGKEQEGSVTVPQATEDSVKQVKLEEKPHATESKPANSVLWLILGFTLVVLLW